jgi:uncharacterized membrane protein
MQTLDQTKEDAGEGRKHIFRKLANAPEGKIFAAGLLLALLYLGAIAMTARWSPGVFQKLLTMTGTHIFLGRAMGMTWGYQHGFTPWIVIVTNMAIETFVVLLFYPLFVLSYRKLIVIGPLEDAMARAKAVAEAHQGTIMKFGVPALLLFVWFPLHMTGPLVGCVIGFLIGLHAAVNLCIVLAGTYLAILCWGLLLDRLYAFLEALGPYPPFIFVACILLLAVSVHIRYALARHEPPADTDPAEQDGSSTR